MNNSTDNLKAFLQAFKIALKSALIYPPHHPGFQGSIKNLHHCLSSLLSWQPSLAIKISPAYLQIGETTLDNESLSQDLARFLHLRQLKVVIIKEGVTEAELVQLIKILSLPLRDYYQQGGAAKFKAEDLSSHIEVEKLDYSSLLTGQGNEIKDIWAYLLHESIGKNDAHLFSQVEESFTHFLQSATLEKILEDQDLCQGLTQFFDRLKATQAPTYHERIKEFVQAFRPGPQQDSSFPLDKFKQYLDDLREEDLATLLVEELFRPEDIDVLRWQLLSQIIPEEKSKKIQELMKELILKQASNLNNERAQAKIRQILSTPNYPLSKTYKAVLENINLEAETRLKVPFDFAGLTKNYQSILLNLLYWEQDQLNRQKITEALLKEIDSALQDQDYEFLLFLYPHLQANQEQLPLEEVNQIKKNIIRNVEQSILEGEKNIYFQELINLFETSYYSDNVYLEAIFGKKIITPYLLQAYLHFFGEHLFYFFLNLDKSLEDNFLSEKMIANLELIDSPHLTTILKHIFPLVTPSLQVKILQIFRQRDLDEDQFIFPFLKSKNYRLRQEASQILLQKPEMKDKVLRQLLLMPSPLGLRNKELRQNVKVMAEIGLPAAKPYLEQLAKRKFFWNKKLREEARGALSKIKNQAKP